MANVAGWQPEPDDPDQERYWTGGDWTDEVRPTASARSTGTTGVPDHSPELHRALSAAVSDLDAMDDRISTLFDRTEDASPVRSRPTAAPAAEVGHAPEAATATDVDLFGEGDVAWAEDDADAGGVRRDGDVVADRMAIIDQYEDDIGGTFAELDVALAAEEAADSEAPGKVTRSLFRRRARDPSS